MHSSPFQKGILSIVLVIIFALALFDSYMGLKMGKTIHEVILSSSVALLALIGMVLVWMNFVLRWNHHQVSEEGERRTAEAEQWRKDNRESVLDLSAAIDRQFESWELNSTEIEVALLFIKGLSTREIAFVRKVTELEIRQESLAIFSKSGLKDRKELSAYFLEDLLGPRRSSLS